MKEIAEDYANYAKADLNKDLQPIHNTIDEMLTRLEEFESIMKMVEGDNKAYSSHTFSTILECRGEIESLARKIDNLQILVNKVDKDLTTVERQVETAEADIGVPNNKLKTFFKPILGRISKDTSATSTENRAEHYSYRVPRTFRSSNYFPNSDGKYHIYENLPRK